MMLKSKRLLAIRSVISTRSCMTLCALIGLLIPLGVASAQDHEITPWRHNHAGAVSVAFDDGYLSQVTNAVPLLNARGLRATFFLTTSDQEVSWEQWRQLAAQGHEIASHTVTHPWLTELSDAALRYELSESKRVINQNIPSHSCVTIAYPGNLNNLHVQAVTSEYYIAGRGGYALEEGGDFNFYEDMEPVDPPSGVSFGSFKAVNFYNVASDNDPYGRPISQIDVKLDAAVAYSAWYNVYSHTIPDNANYFATILDHILARNLWAATFGEVAKYMRERIGSTLSVLSSNASGIELSLTNSLDGSIYNEPLTIRSKVPSTWLKVNIAQGGSSTIVDSAVEGPDTVVYFDALPNNGTITLTLEMVHPPTLTSISVSPSTASVAVNGTQQFTATAKDQFGNALVPQPSFTWTVSGGGTISSSGLFTAGSTAGGSFSVTASSGSVSGTAIVTVTAPPTLTSISVSPASASVVVNGTQQFTATAKDQFGNALVPQPSFSWTVSGGGTISSSGLFTAGSMAGGPYTVTATSGSVSGTASVTVTDPLTLTSISVSPSSASVVVNGTQQFTATAKDQFGNALVPQPSFSWMVSGGGTISSSGLFTAGSTAGGPFTVTAVSGSVSGTAIVTVTAASTFTIGETSILSGNDSGNGNLLLAQQATLGESATILSMSFYVTSASGNLRLGIYDATGPNGGPGQLKAQTAEFTPVSGWNTRNVVSQVSLAAGTYWLAYLPSSDSLGFRVASTGLTKYYTYSYQALPATFSTSPTSATCHWSFYATLQKATPTLASISVSPSSASVAAGGTQQFTATAKDQFGNALVPQPSFSWTVSGGGTINSSGLFTAGSTAGGPFTVTAASGSVSGTASVTVTVTPTLTSISVSPSSASVAAGSTQQFAATAKDQFGNALVPQPSFTWTVSGGGTISSSGLFTSGSTAGGPFTVTGASGSVSGTASVTVTATPTLTSISVSPSSASVAAGSTQQFAATAKDQFGNALVPQPSFSWTVSGGGTINSSGLFTAGSTAGGPFTVTAASGSVSGTASVTVTVTPTLTSISVSPSSASVAAGSTQQFAATAKDQFGNALVPQPSFSWTVSGGGTINSSGLFTAGSTAGGPFTVTAASGSVSGTASVTVTQTLGIMVTAPNTAVSWRVMTNQNITFTHNLGVGQAVNVDVSRDGGSSWSGITTLTTTSATTGTYSWLVSGPPTTQARIRVTSGANALVTDISDVNFTIVNPVITVTAPNTAVSWRVGATKNVTFTHNMGVGQTASIDVSRDGGATWSLVTTFTTTSATSGTYSWVVSGPPTTQAKIRVSWTVDASVTDRSDVNFTILPRTTVTAPNTAVTWAAGSTRTVTWTHNLGAGGTVNIEFSPDNGATWAPVALGVASATATTGTYTGPMPMTVTTQGLIRVSPTIDPTLGDVSDVPFMLATPKITVSAPNSNVTWAIGSTQSIKWSHNLGKLESVKIELARDGINYSETIAASATNTANTSSTFSWVVTGPATTTARIRVTWVADVAVTDISNVNFKIQ